MKTDEAHVSKAISQLGSGDNASPNFLDDPKDKANLGNSNNSSQCLTQRQCKPQGTMSISATLEAPAHGTWPSAWGLLMSIKPVPNLDQSWSPVLTIVWA